AVLVALVVLGAPPAAGERLSGVFQDMAKFECRFMNGTEKVRFVQRNICNRVEDARFGSDVGKFVGFSPSGEKQARHWNSDPEGLQYEQADTTTTC
ncbi:HB2D protein, partial [Dasyornis broadbenti]|nr:HB2D protein [Dasyornis broadbenti]